MNKPPLDTSIRESLAQHILAALQEAQPGSIAELRGSLASGTADAYSDIDILWEVPDENFTSAVAGIASTLGQVQAIASLRMDPDTAHSAKHRLVFLQFVEIPLFWRLDLEVFAQSVHRDPEYDRQNSPAVNPDWSPTHSALMNAVAAVKALLRNQEGTARGLLVRAFERIGLPIPLSSSPVLITVLCRSVTAIDPTQVNLAEQVLDLHHQVFGGNPAR